MKLINQSAEYLPQSSGIEGIYKAIELAGRTSYLSWDKMTDDSAKKFVDMLIKSKHTSVLEHGTVYLTIPCSEWDNYVEFTWGYGSYPYVKYDDSECDWEKGKGNVYITTNYRVIVENHWKDDLKYLCEPTEFHEKRLSVKVITDIGVTREFNRHRTFSIVEQSTRYCNFSKDKFGNEITFIKPSWLSREQLGNHDVSTIIMQTEELLDCGNYKDEELAELIYLNSCARAEEDYLKLIELGWKPQQARQVLPLNTKTEVVYTAFESDWRHFFDLRLFGKTGEPHPQMKQLAELIKQEFEKAGAWEGIIKYPSKYD